MKHSPEPTALKELHKIRAQMLKEAEKVGVDAYYLQLNESSEWLRGKKTRKRQAAVVREKPSRKYGSG
jgi:hypothetical protein